MAIIIKGNTADQDQGVILVQQTDDVTETTGTPSTPTDGLTQEEADLLYAGITHTHPISSITNLQTTLDSKANTSSLAPVATSGIYDDLTGRPTLGTAAPRDVPPTGNASSTQVVLGSDTRLTDARTPTTHTHAASDINSGTFALARIPTIPNTQTSGFGTASTRNVPASGNAATTEVVLGTDTRLTDARTPTAHNQDASTITTGTFALARIPTIPQSQTSGFGTSALLNVPGTAGTNATATQVVRGDDPRLTDARTPIAHNQDASTITTGVLNFARLPAASTASQGAIQLEPTGDTTKFLSGAGTWLTPAGGGGGATNLDGLTDVVITSPVLDQQLRFNGTNWINFTPTPIPTLTSQLTNDSGFVVNTLTLTAGTGLTGGGSLSANRTFSLSDTAVTPGTYPKVTVDQQGRITAGASLLAADIPNLDTSKLTTGILPIARGGTGSTTQNFVDLTTAQTVAGIKSFSAGTLNLTNATSNFLIWGAGAAIPSFTTRSVGTKIVLANTVAAAASDYALGIETSNMWFSVANAAAGYKWYAGTTNIASLSGAGALTLSTPLALANGGTGANAAAGARTNLGLGTAAVLNVPAVAASQATSSEIVRGDDPRLVPASGSITVSATAPASPTNNQLWFDTITNEIYFYDLANTRWLSIGPTVIDKTVDEGDLNDPEIINFNFTSNNYLVERMHCSIPAATGTVNSSNYWWVALGSATNTGGNGTTICGPQFFSTSTTPAPVVRNTTWWFDCVPSPAASALLTAAGNLQLRLSMNRTGSPTQTTIKANIKIFIRKIRI